MLEGVEAWEKQKARSAKDPAFHMAEVIDPVQALIDRIGWDGAFEQIQEEFNSNPDDPEARRQAKLVVTLMEKRTADFKEKLNH